MRESCACATDFSRDNLLHDDRQANNGHLTQPERQQVNRQQNHLSHLPGQAQRQ